MARRDAAVFAEFVSARSASRAAGACKVVGETRVSETQGLFVIPTGDPMDT